MERHASWATFASQRLTRARPRLPPPRPRPHPRAYGRSSRGRRRRASARAAAAAPPRSRRRRARARRPRGRSRRRGAPRRRPGRRGRVAETDERLGGVSELLRVGGWNLDRGTPDLRLEGRRGPLGDDAGPVDDPDAVSEHVRLLEVLRGEEHGHALLPREAGDLRPEGAPALGIEAGGGLVEEEDRGTVDEREGQVEAALHPAGVGADAALGGERRGRRARAARPRAGAARRRSCRGVRPSGGCGRGR